MTVTARERVRRAGETVEQPFIGRLSLDRRLTLVFGASAEAPEMTTRAPEPAGYLRVGQHTQCVHTGLWRGDAAPYAAPPFEPPASRAAAGTAGGRGRHPRAPAPSRSRPSGAPCRHPRPAGDPWRRPSGSLTSGSWPTRSRTTSGERWLDAFVCRRVVHRHRSRHRPVQRHHKRDRLVLALPRRAPRNLQPRRVSHRRARRPPALDRQGRGESKLSARQSQNPKVVTPKRAENRLR